jgi:flagellar biosynthesis regulator FlaF
MREFTAIRITADARKLAVMTFPAVVIAENALPRWVRVARISLGVWSLAHVGVVPSLLLAAWEFALAH